MVFVMKRLPELFFDLLNTKFELLVLLEVYELWHTVCCDFIVYFVDEIRTHALFSSIHD